MEKTLRILGIACIAIGIAATAVSFMPYGIFLGIILSFFGMVLSTIYIFLDMKHQINTAKITAGVIGMFLSSIPVLIMIGIMIYSKMTS